MKYNPHKYLSFWGPLGDSPPIRNKPFMGPSNAPQGTKHQGHLGQGEVRPSLHIRDYRDAERGRRGRGAEGNYHYYYSYYIIIRSSSSSSMIYSHYHYR